MKKRFCAIAFMYTQLILTQQADFNSLLKCNLLGNDIASACNVTQELAIYSQHLQSESNYVPIPTLEGWVFPEENYPKTVHPFNQIILDMLKDLSFTSVCEVGAGCGKICKYLYARNPQLDITCIEHNSTHLQHMRENFEYRPWVVEPNIRVKANIVKGSLPHIPSLKSNSFDVVFSSTVFMHLPFIIAVQAAQEVVRLTKRYILHVENKNNGNQWYNMTIVLPAGMSSANLVGIDYPKLYESLGVKTLHYSEFRDPASPATFIVYLGEKI